MSNERGHAININNYGILIDRCTQLGTGYQPVRAEIKIAAMTSKKNDAVTKQDDYLQSIADAKVKIVARDDLFEGMMGIARRIEKYF